MKDYEINDSTLAIIPSKEFHSLVLEDDFQYDVERTPMDIVNCSCNYFGSSYLGRKEGARNILNSAYKLPVIVEDSRNLVFLPTTSPEEEECAWIALNKIKSFSRTGDGTSNTVVEFHNGQKIIIDISYKSLENQILRASRLESVVRNRKSDKNF